MSASHHPKADPPQRRDWQGVGCHGAGGLDCVDAEDVLHEQRVCPRIINVSGGDKSAQNRNAVAHENLEARFDHDGRGARRAHGRSDIYPSLRTLMQGYSSWPREDARP